MRALSLRTRTGRCERRASLTGPAFQFLGGLDWPFASRLSLVGEYRLTRGAASVSIPGGELATTLYTHHFITGPCLRLP
jgi:hypothetical protein